MDDEDGINWCFWLLLLSSNWFKTHKAQVAFSINFLFGKHLVSRESDLVSSCIRTKKIFIIRGITPKSITQVAGPISAAQRQDNTVPKKHRSGGEPLATLCPISLAWESNPKLPVPIALCLTTKLIGHVFLHNNLSLF